MVSEKYCLFVVFILIVVVCLFIADCINKWFYSVEVSTRDFESCNLGSNPSRAKNDISRCLCFVSSVGRAFGC